jgi:hypothetical protein
MSDNSVFVLRSILNSVFKNKDQNILVYLLSDTFGYPIIRVRSRLNNIIDVANTKLGHYLVKKY